MASNGKADGGCLDVLEKLARSRYAAAMLLGGFVLSVSVMALYLGYWPPFPPLISGFRLPGRRRKRPIRVYIDGCFDMMHYGHCNALRQARALGDELVVGVVSDEEISENKGPPVTPIKERMIMVGAVKWVDEVIPDAPYTINEEFMYKLFNEYGIDYIIHGDDPCLLPDGTDAYALAKKAGRYKQIKRTEGVSSTDIVVQNVQLSQLAARNSLSGKKHDRSFSDMSDPSTPRNFADSRNIAIYTDMIAFTLFELETITRSFRPDYVLGEGGFGTVYKGYIDENVRTGLKSLPVAVKVLNKHGLQGHKEWLAEVNFLGQLRHPNLVKLIGYCCEDDHRLLVYEFMFRGSLENHLFRKTTSPLSWATRMMIALGAAKGLAFLHNAEKPVIYRDFKTSNILLDSDYSAKLSDFGLAKAGPQGDETHVSTRVMGTYGYAAPEYVMTGHLTSRSDVYSFGVVLLELLTGRKSIDKTRPGKEQSLVDWARPRLNDKKKLLQIVDPNLEGQYSMRAAQKSCSLAYYCLSQNPKARPLMSDVVKTLEPLQESNGMNAVPDGRMSRRLAATGVGCRPIPTAKCSSPGAVAAR